MTDLTPMAERIAGHHDFCAAAIREYRERRGWTMQQVAEYLRCDLPTLARIGLCRQPVVRGVDFERDEHGWWRTWNAEVEKIAAYAGVAASDLAAILNDEGKI